MYIWPLYNQISLYFKLFMLQYPVIVNVELENTE